MVFLVVFLDIEIDRAIALISKTVVENLLHQLLLLDDMSRGMRLDAGGQYVERLHRLMVAVGVILCDLHRLQLLQSCLLLDLVIPLVGIVLQVSHIRDVTHIAHLVSQMLQVTEENIKGDGWARMTQMGVAIYGWTAHIHSHIGRMQGFKTLLLSVKGIVNQQCLFHIQMF